MKQSSSSSSSSSSSPSLEITVISAEDLRINRRSINKNAFVTIETDPNNSQSTGIDSQGGSYPCWNHKLELPLPYGIKHIRVEAKCKVGVTTIGIGSVSIPITDIFEDYTPPNCLHFLSYRLRDSNGERNGIVNFSVLMKGGSDYVRPTPTYIKVQGACRPMPPPSSAAGYSYSYSNSTGDMAIGIPISKRYMY